MQQRYVITCTAPEDREIHLLVLAAHSLYGRMDQSMRIQDLIDQLNSAKELDCEHLYHVECELIP